MRTVRHTADRSAVAAATRTVPRPYLADITACPMLILWRRIYSICCACALPDSAGPSFGLSRFLQANLFRRNAVYITAILLGCSFGVQAYDAAFDAAWEFNNKGVSA